MRVGRRLSRAVMPDDAKQQAILRRIHTSQSLCWDTFNDITAHVGRNHTLAQLRQQFWIPGDNGAIRRFLFSCVIRKRKQAAILPDDPPFTRVGIDYFGPFLVKRGRVQVKRYAVIFTCQVKDKSKKCIQIMAPTFDHLTVRWGNWLRNGTATRLRNTCNKEVFSGISTRQQVLTIEAAGND